MVGLGPTIHPSTSSGACGWLDPRTKSEDDSFCRAVSAAHIWNFYKTVLRAHSNSYGAPDNYPTATAGHPTRRPDRPCSLEQPMLDLILLAASLAFFVLSVAYAYGCERL